MTNSSPVSEFDVYFVRSGEERYVFSSLASAKRPDGISLLKIHSSGLLDVSERREADRILLRDAGLSISSYLQDLHYIPRLVLSSLLFLAVYLFLSLAVRDPIPLVDELAAASVCTILFWIWSMKRDSTAALSGKLMLELTRKVKDALVVNDDFLGNVEAYMYDIQRRYSQLELCNLLAAGRGLLLFTGELPDSFTQILFSYLEGHDGRTMRFLSLLEKRRRDEKKTAAMLYTAAGRREIDLSLVCFLYSISIK